MEFIIMDAYLVILLLYVFLFIRKIVRLVIRLVKRPGAEEKVVETRVISRRTAENAQSKAEAAKAVEVKGSPHSHKVGTNQRGPSRRTANTLVPMDRAVSLCCSTGSAIDGTRGQSSRSC